MSARATPRAPAGTRTVIRHYLGMLGSGGGAWGIGTGVLVACLSSLGSDGAHAFSGVQSALGLAWLLPLLHWRESSRASASDPAMPLDRARHDLVRVLCGAAWACAAFLVLVGLFMAASLFGEGPRFGGYPWWYPFPAASAGLVLYLLGSAVWLRAERPGRVLLVSWLLFFIVGGRVIWLLGGRAGAETFEWATVGLTWSSRGGLQASAAQWALGSAVWLTVAWGLVWACASADRWTARVRWGLPRVGLPAPRRRSAAPRPERAVPGLRRAPGAWAGFRRELLLVGGRMPWLLAFALFLAWTWFEQESDASNTTPAMAHDPRMFGILSNFSLLPVLVWLDGRGPGREYEDAFPVDVGVRRALRVAAGAAWLGLVLAPLLASTLAGDLAGGKLDSLASAPARVWLGVPGATLMLYLLGSLPVLLARRRPLQWTFALWVALVLLVELPEASGSPGWHGWLYSPLAAMHPLGLSPWAGQSWERALALWLAVAVAATVAAAAAGARRDREGRRSRPGRVRTGAHPAPA